MPSVHIALVINLALLATGVNLFESIYNHWPQLESKSSVTAVPTHADSMLGIGVGLENGINLTYNEDGVSESNPGGSENRFAELSFSLRDSGGIEHLSCYQTSRINPNAPAWLSGAGRWSSDSLSSIDGHNMAPPEDEDPCEFCPHCQSPYCDSPWFGKL